MEVSDSVKKDSASRGKILVALIVCAVALVAESALIFFMAQNPPAETVASGDDVVAVVDKADLMPLPQPQGDDLLRGHSFLLDDGTFYQSWTFADDGTVLVEKKWSVDSRIPVNLKYRAAYSYDGIKKILFVKPISLFLDNVEYKSSVRIGETASALLLNSVESKWGGWADEEDKKKAGEILFRRVRLMVENWLYEIISYSIEVEAHGLLFSEAAEEKLLPVGKNLSFESADCEPLIRLERDFVVIDVNDDSGTFFVGVPEVNTSTGKIVCRTYKIDSVEKIAVSEGGTFIATVSRAIECDDGGSLAYSLKVDSLSPALGVRKGFVFTSSYPLYGPMKWMVRQD